MNDVNKRNIDELNYYLKEDNKNSSFKGKLKIGDIVKLKYNHYIIKIEYVQL